MNKKLKKTRFSEKKFFFTRIVIRLVFPFSSLCTFACFPPLLPSRKPLQSHYKRKQNSKEHRPSPFCKTQNRHVDRHRSQHSILEDKTETKTFTQPTITNQLIRSSFHPSLFLNSITQQTQHKKQKQKTKTKKRAPFRQRKKHGLQSKTRHAYVGMAIITFRKYNHQLIMELCDC